MAGEEKGTILDQKGDTGGGDDQATKDAAAAKAATDQAAADKVTTDAAAAKKAADDAAKPIAYDTVKLADGSLLDKSDLEKVIAYATEKKLTPEQAADLLTQREQAATDLTARQTESFKKQIDQWASDVKSDKDLGGANFDATLADVKLAMDKFAPEGSTFRKIVNESGYGNHPEFVRFVAAIGKAMKEDKGLGNAGGGGNTNNNDKPNHEVFYKT